MNNWVARRQQEAFSLYRRYIAMQLHLKAGSSFDYTTYGGGVRGSFDTFKAKEHVYKRFMQLVTVLDHHNIDHELFVFCHARYGIDIAYGDIQKCVQRFDSWNTKYGTKEALFKTAVSIIRTIYLHNGNIKTPEDIAMTLLESNSNIELEEALICQLHLHPPLVVDLNARISGNAILELKWNNFNKIRSLYYHFGILN